MSFLPNKRFQLAGSFCPSTRMSVFWRAAKTHQNVTPCFNGGVSAFFQPPCSHTTWQLCLMPHTDSYCIGLLSVLFGMHMFLLSPFHIQVIVQWGTKNTESVVIGHLRLACRVALALFLSFFLLSVLFLGGSPVIVGIRSWKQVRTVMRY